MAGPDDRRLRELAQRHGLAEGAIDQLSRLAVLLGGDPEAPTTVRAPRQILDDHLADSLVALELPELRAAKSIADLGAGAGLPGLPLAIALPEARVSLVDSNARKGRFIERAITAVGAQNASVVIDRAESWTDGIGRFDVVTARAVAPLSVVAEYSAPLLRLGGVLVAWRGRREPQVEAEAGFAAEILAMSVRQPLHVKPYPEVEHRYLHVMVKVGETPSRFPRRPGMARKRPLGSGVAGRPGGGGRGAGGGPGAGGVRMDAPVVGEESRGAGAGADTPTVEGKAQRADADAPGGV